MKARKRHDLANGRGQEWAEEFNRRFPVGAKVWYWTSLPFGPVVETFVRRPATVLPEGLSNAGMAVAFIAARGGYIALAHLSEPQEARRGDVQFLTID